VSIRVVHISASFPRSDDDAVAPFLADLVHAQRDAGWSPAVVAAHDAGLPRRNVVAGVSVRRVRYAPDRAEVLVYRGAGHGGLSAPWHAALLPGLFLALLVGAVREVRAHRASVVHAHWLLPGGLVAALLPRRSGLRFVLTLHGTDVELASGRLRPVARWIAGRADAVLAVSEPLARRAEDVFGWTASRIGVARLPLSSAIEPSPLPPHPPCRLLAAGRASREKGLDVLVEALALDGAAAWSATLVTEGPERPALEARIAALGLGDRVQVRDLCPHEQLFELMREHHALVVPSRSEGLGMVAVEALAAGRPVIASAVGGLPEVVTDGVDGTLVPPDDPAALARAIGALPLVPPAAPAVARHQPAAVLAAHADAYCGDR
jgi:glycosyltransferase involved in cell wall biosynthesis